MPKGKTKVGYGSHYKRRRYTVAIPSSGPKMGRFIHRSGINYRTVVQGYQVGAFNSNAGTLQAYAFLFHYPGYVSSQGLTPGLMTVMSGKWAPQAPTTKLNGVFDDYRVVKMTVTVRPLFNGNSLVAGASAPGGSGVMDIMLSHDVDSYLTATNFIPMLNDNRMKSIPLLGGGSRSMSLSTTKRDTVVPHTQWFDTNNAVPIAYNTALTTLNAFPANPEPYASTTVLIPASQNFNGGVVSQAICEIFVKWYVEFKGETVVR